MIVRIENFDRLPNTPALRLAVRCWHELLESGFIDLGATAVNWDHRAIVVFDDEKAVGMLTWTDQEWANQVGVVLAYVVPEHRRKGYHAMMWQELIRQAQQLKRSVISSSTHVANVASRCSMRAQGRDETGVHVRFKVPLA